MRLIDADALEKAFSSMRYGRGGKATHWGDRDDWVLKGREVARLIEDAPTIEDARTVAVLKEATLTRKRWYCTNCGTTFGGVCVGYKYCPECGARVEVQYDD